VFELTALGNHSWLVEAGGNHVLIDPTLTQRYGPTPAQGVEIYPPREIDLSAMPAIDAVFISHEHEGHFELPTLARLDRRIPIWLSENCSIAARDVLSEMGFRVELARAGRAIEIGALTLVPSAGVQDDMDFDEWDNLGALVYDRDGHGSFYTTIDNAPHLGDIELVRRHVRRPGIWALTVNDTDAEFGGSLRSDPPPHFLDKTREALALYQQLLDELAAPELMLMVGGGFSFSGAHAWLNETIFPIQHERLARVIDRLLPEQRVAWPLPGQRFRMQDGRLVDVGTQAWVKLCPREQWPPREEGAVRWMEELSPITGRTELAEGELELLQAELDHLAEHLYDRAPFHLVHSLSRAAVGGREPTLALVLRDGDGAFVYEWDPTRCRFVASEQPDPVTAYAMVYEAWAPDMLASLRCEIANHALSVGHSRQWWASAGLFDLNKTLIAYLTPTRWPERFLARYRRIAAEAEGPVQIVYQAS
jgi:hypothetical protein